MRRWAETVVQGRSNFNRLEIEGLVNANNMEETQKFKINLYRQLPLHTLV
jgi:hypothetical protein